MKKSVLIGIIVGALVIAGVIAGVVAILDNNVDGTTTTQSTTTTTTTTKPTTTTTVKPTTTTTTTTTVDNDGNSGDSDIKTDPSEGLQFDLNNNKNGYYVSKGTCTDTVIVIPDTHNGLPVVGIGAGGFLNCKWMTGIVIPDSVTSIGANAFANCTALESITIPATVKSFGGMEFDNCTSLATIIFDGTIDQWNAISKYDWSMNSSVPANEVTCSDGVATLN